MNYLSKGIFKKISEYILAVMFCCIQLYWWWQLLRPNQAHFFAYTFCFRYKITCPFFGTCVSFCLLFVCSEMLYEPEVGSRGDGGAQNYPVSRVWKDMLELSALNLLWRSSVRGSNSHWMSPTWHLLGVLFTQEWTRKEVLKKDLLALDIGHMLALAAL